MLNLTRYAKLYIYPLLDFNEDMIIQKHKSEHYLSYYDSSVSEEINQTFLIDREIELNNLLSSYPFNETDLTPPSDDGIFYTPEMLETYRNNKILEIVPPYVFNSLKSWSYDYLSDLAYFLFSNFGDKNYVLNLGNIYYSLKENKKIDYNEMTFHLYELLKCKIYRVRQTPEAVKDENGYYYSFYNYFCYLDITQFLEYVGLSNSDLPILPLPDFTDEQYQIMPNSFYNMIYNDISNYSPLKTGNNKFGDSYIFPNIHIFNNTMGEYQKSDSYLKMIDFAPATSLGDTFLTVTEQEFINTLTQSPHITRLYNAFHPYEFYFILPITSKRIFIEAPKQFGGTQTKLKSEDIRYKIYKFKLNGHSQYSQYFNNLNFNFELSLDDNKPKIKKCCLLDCIKKQK